MLIEGPLKIGVLDYPERRLRELHLDFVSDFKVLSLADQGSSFRDYVSTLGNQLAALDEADPNRAGMLIVQQIAEQLLPHIEAGDLALEETIIIEMGADEASLSLMDLLN